MSAAQSACFSTGSTERPINFTLRRSNSGLILARWPSSVVQIGVKLRGCEKSTPHESPSQSWKLITPSVVWASKSGAVSPRLSAIVILLFEVVRAVAKAGFPTALDLFLHVAQDLPLAGA